MLALKVCRFMICFLMHPLQKSLVLTLLLLGGCVSTDPGVQEEAVDDIDSAVMVSSANTVPSGEFIVVKERTLALIADGRGEDSWAFGKELMLHKDDTLTVISVVGPRSSVLLASGQKAFVYSADIAPVVVEPPSVPVLPEGNAQPAYPVTPKRPPAPVNRALIEESNEVQLPE